MLTTRHALVSTFRSPVPVCGGAWAELDGDAADEEEEDEDESAARSLAIGPRPVTCGDEPRAM